MKELNFITKAKTSARTQTDISVRANSVGSDGAHANRVTVTVRNGCDKKIGMNGYTVVAIDNGRMYFSNANSSVGFKLSRNRSGNKYTIGITEPSLRRWAEKYQGDYDLMFDGDLNYWYIDADFCYR